MRIAGILILGVIISIYGFISANKLISENSQLEKIIKIISIIKLKMRYSNEKITDLVKDLSVDYSFLFLELNCSFENYFNKICFENKNLNLSAQEKQELFSFFECLGKSDLQNQLTLCDNYIKIFENILQEHKEKSKSKIKLYPSLSILTGMLVVLILI